MPATPTSTRRRGAEFPRSEITYNLTNQVTDYQNGVDFHLDMAASQFLSKQFFVGAVGYLYDQVSADNGSAPILASDQVACRWRWTAGGIHLSRRGHAGCRESESIF